MCCLNEVFYITLWPCCCRVFPCPEVSIGFLGRWGTYVCPQCLPVQFSLVTLPLAEAGPGRFGCQRSFTEI